MTLKPVNHYLLISRHDQTQQKDSNVNSTIDLFAALSKSKSRDEELKTFELVTVQDCSDDCNIRYITGKQAYVLSHMIEEITPGIYLIQESGVVAILKN